jgi:hypothetical protein
LATKKFHYLHLPRLWYKPELSKQSKKTWITSPTLGYRNNPWYQDLPLGSASTTKTTAPSSYKIAHPMKWVWKLETY